MMKRLLLFSFAFVLHGQTSFTGTLSNGTVGTTASTSTCGNNAAGGGGSESGNVNYAMGNNGCTPSANVTVQSCSIVLDLGGTGNLSCAVYATSTGASSGTPTGAPLCSSGSVAATGTGTNTLPLSGCGTLTSGTNYAIVWGTDTSANGISKSTTSETAGFYQSSTFPTYPSGGTWTSYSPAQQYRLWLNVTP